MRGTMGCLQNGNSKFKKTTDSQHNKAVDIEPVSTKELLRRGTQREMGCRHQLYLDLANRAELYPGRHCSDL